MSHYRVNSVSGSAASVSFIGIPYSDIDRTGHWAVWCISKMFEAARLAALLDGFLDYRRIIDEENALAIIKQQLNLDPKVHSVSLTSPMKLKFDHEFKQLKKTSIMFAVKLKNEATEEILGENFIKVVRINRKTRRSSSFPEYFYEKYAAFMNTPGHSGTEKEDLPEIPRHAYKYVVIPGHSDEDFNGHLNQSSFIRFCMDAATNASLKGYYEHYTSDMCLYPSLQWTISYVGESLAGDQLTIYTWQKEDTADNIRFAIVRNGNRIFYASTVFGKNANEIRFWHKL
ncbi:uncharacterized protein LOC133190097 [Saccostrea echinata]|uniref:uncharacterized protein LOC133190097 n=1 Tax=Saccostrea echinata TaxID=191078 RepID=UPI002A7F3229|nr:uncharacterized protein LOC133190097 [Saccostrea echinata]